MVELKANEMHIPDLRTLGGVLLLFCAIPLGNANAQSTQPIPENAVAQAYGQGWECRHGFRRKSQVCDRIFLPAHAYLTGESYGDGWDCERGFRKANAICLAIAVPVNGYLADHSTSEGWTCERGFEKKGMQCVSIALPANGFLSEFGYHTYALTSGAIACDLTSDEEELHGTHGQEPGRSVAQFPEDSA